jgi:hypothetical protein
MRKFLIIALLLVATAPTMAASLKRAAPEDIDMLLNAASGMNSSFWASYIGETHGRIYIEYGTAIHTSSFSSKESSQVVYWFPANEISQERLNKLKEYKDKYEAGKLNHQLKAVD